MTRSPLSLRTISSRRTTAFTMIELLVIMAILALMIGFLRRFSPSALKLSHFPSGVVAHFRPICYSQEQV